jgi:hypothetical protein
MTAYISGTEETASLTFIVALTISAFSCLQRSLFGLLTLIEGKRCLDTLLYFTHMLNIHIFEERHFIVCFYLNHSSSNSPFYVRILCEFS